jgi:hypothetical protein
MIPGWYGGLDPGGTERQVLDPVPEPGASDDRSLRVTTGVCLLSNTALCGDISYRGASCDWLHIDHDGQVNAVESRMRLVNSSFRGAANAPWRIRVKDCSLEIVDGSVQGNLLAEGGVLTLERCRIQGDVTLDNHCLKIERTRIEGSLTLRAQGLELGADVQVRELVLRPPKALAPGRSWDGIVNVFLRPGAHCEFVRVDAPGCRVYRQECGVWRPV